MEDDNTFFRVKQLADQTFSRAGKTEVLSDDLQEADRKVEYIKTSCQNVGKKLSTCLLLGQLQGESGAKEKLLKKTSGYQLGVTMAECAAVCDEDSLMKTVLNKCGYAEKCLSEENVEHDHRVEQYVIAPLQNVIETEIPNISKQKKNVTKVCLDLDSAKARYQQAQKHNSNTAGAAKIEIIKDELKDYEQKVEQSRDVLACEMFHLAAKESELCHTILQYYKFQKRYHEYALSILDQIIPDLEDEICSSKTKPVYGVDIHEHLKVTGRKIAFPIELCVCALLEIGMDEEGLFRLAGGASKVKRMKLSFDAGCMTLATAISYRDPHVIAGALKSYLRELPEPLLTHDLYDEWLNAAKAQTHPDNKLQALWTVVHKLPQVNFDNLSYLIKFFHILSKNHEVNKMCPHNIAIVIAPSLIWTKEENNGSGFGLNVNVSLYPSIIDLLVTYADWFFDKDMDFYMTLEPVMNGEHEEKSTERGIDNKGFDIKIADKLQKNLIDKGFTSNHPAGDSENVSDIKRSQSISSLSEEVNTYDSPKPITRRKNKSVAPVPPIFREDSKKEEGKIVKDTSQVSKLKETHALNGKPDKPPRPSIMGNATLPRPSKSNKVTETNEEEEMILSADSRNSVKSLLEEKQLSSSVKTERVIKTVATVSTNTDSFSQISEYYSSNSSDNKKERPTAAPRVVNANVESIEKPKGDSEIKASEYSKVDLLNAKKEWLLGKDNLNVENLPLKKPAVPERPSTLRPQTHKFNRNSFEVNLRNNYENISFSSNECLSNGALDERTLQKTQIYSIDKQQVSIIKVGTEEKGKVENIISSEDTACDEKTDDVESKHQKNDSEMQKDDLDNRSVVVPVEERKTPIPSARPQSLPGTDKPERPPKPDYKFSSPTSSHTRTFSDGQLTDNKSSDYPNNNNSVNIHDNNSNNSQGVKYVINNNVSNEITGASTSSSIIKHPQTSPPPPPVPVKPRVDSKGETTDF